MYSSNISQYPVFDHTTSIWGDRFSPTGMGIDTLTQVGCVLILSPTRVVLTFSHTGMSTDTLSQRLMLTLVLFLEGCGYGYYPPKGSGVLIVPQDPILPSGTILNHVIVHHMGPYRFDLVQLDCMFSQRIGTDTLTHMWWVLWVL